MKPILGIFMPKKRPQDNIKINANSPSEEEHPLTNITEKCGMQMFFFPQNISYFDKYDTFADITKAERSDWKKSYYWLLQNIAYYAGSKKKLLLKNPHSMGRIEVLLELFPNAKFIHIHRNPYEVYNSNVHLYTKTISTQFLQDFNTEDIEERVIYCYEKIMQKFFDTWSLIPDDNKIEVSFSDLSNQPMETLANIYSALNLGDFSKVSPSFEAYLNKEKDYKKNKFLEIRPEILEDINTRWQFSFNKLGYNIENNGD